MVILYDARKISKNQVGVGYVTEKILEHLSTFKNLKIIAFTRKGVRELPFSHKGTITVHETNDDSDFFGLKRILFEQKTIPQLIKKYKPDILHLTNGFSVPYFINKQESKIKIILTIHDLIPLTSYWELMSGFDRFLYKIFLRRSLILADEIISVSNKTAEDLQTYFPWLKNTKTIYNGIEIDKSSSKNLNKVFKIIKNKYSISENYILYIGGFAPRKNVLRLIESYNLLLNSTKNRLDLIIVGKFSHNNDINNNMQAINSLISKYNLKNKVHLINYINYEEKVSLYCHAIFFVYISLYEGFGLPILESLSLGTPVISSKNSAMEEIAGKYVLYTDPYNIENIKNNMSELLNRYQHFKKLAFQAKTELLPKYNWENVGKEYYFIYQQLSVDSSDN